MVTSRNKKKHKNSICVVVPAHNEEKKIGKVISTMPNFVDLIIVVDDASSDKTTSLAQKAANSYKKKVEIIKISRQRGVGGAIVEGYRRARQLKFTVTAVMAGDGQMDPKELKGIVEPIILKQADYVKGNRLVYEDSWQKIPKVRYLGNAALSLLTKIASGYWQLTDSQTGYTAISLTALERINIDKLYNDYGFPNDVLINLNTLNFKIKEIPIKPIYYTNAKSGMKLWKVIPRISWLLFRRFWWRMKVKYIIEDFHPLVFFYLLAFILGLCSLFLFGRLLIIWIRTDHLPPINTLAFFFCLTMTTQFATFAMWFDMDYNKDLKVK